MTLSSSLCWVRSGFLWGARKLRQLFYHLTRNHSFQIVVNSCSSQSKQQIVRNLARIMCTNWETTQTTHLPVTLVALVDQIWVVFDDFCRHFELNSAVFSVILWSVELITLILSYLPFGKCCFCVHQQKFSWIIIKIQSKRRFIFSSWCTFWSAQWSPIAHQVKARTFPWSLFTDLHHLWCWHNNPVFSLGLVLDTYHDYCLWFR